MAIKDLIKHKKTDKATMTVLDTFKLYSAEQFAEFISSLLSSSYENLLRNLLNELLSFQMEPNSKVIITAFINSMLNKAPEFKERTKSDYIELLEKEIPNKEG